jgi:hypothetical protein
MCVNQTFFPTETSRQLKIPLSFCETQIKTQIANLKTNYDLLTKVTKRKSQELKITRSKPQQQQ